MEARLRTFATTEELSELIDRGGGNTYKFRVGVDVLDVRHSYQRCRNSRRGSHELQSPLRVVF